jgi:hypothetical protein
MDREQKNELIKRLTDTIPAETRKEWADSLPQVEGRYTFNGMPGVWTRDATGVWTDPSGNWEPVEANFILGAGGKGGLWKRVPDTKLKERG